MKKPIYLDYHATTPVDPRVVKAMLPYFTDIFGNAASIDHGHGHAAQEAVEKSRNTIARFINANSPDEIVFTSGATESNNIALLGVAEAYSHKGDHFITSAVEHKAVLDTLGYMARRGFKTTVLPTDRYGRVDPCDVEKAITDKTVLISIMLANNEIGTIQPIDEIGKIARNHGVFFHTDAAQAVGHIPVDVQDLNVDLMSFTAHKAYGPKGIGSLYARASGPRVKPAPVIRGGGHERGIRSGTLNVPAIVGFASALSIADKEMAEEGKQLREWTEWMFEEWTRIIEGVERNGHPTERLPHNLNIYVPGVESRGIVLDMREIMSFSTGSACTTARIEPSHVILALGLAEERAHSSFRFGLGRFTTGAEVETAADSFARSINDVRLRFMAAF